MQVGDLVKVETKFYGKKVGVILALKEDDSFGTIHHVLVATSARDIHAHPADVEVLSEAR